MSIGENIQKLRKQSGLSQEELSEKLFVTRQTVSKWELGQSSPDLDYIVKLGEIFNVSTDFLIKGEDNKPVPAVQSSKTIFGKNPLGASLTIGGAIGIFVFIILSTFSDWYVFINGDEYHSLFAFLFCERFTGIFYILCDCVIYGIALLWEGTSKRKEFNVFGVKYNYKFFSASLVSVLSGFSILPLSIFFADGNSLTFIYRCNLLLILILIFTPIVVYFIKRRKSLL